MTHNARFACLSRSLSGVALLLLSAVAVAACSGGDAAPAEEPADTPSTETDDDGDDDGTDDAPAAGDAGTKNPDAGKNHPDAGTKEPDAGTKEPGYDYGKPLLDESCYAPGNFARFPEVQASPDGRYVVFQRCDDDRSVVLRDLAAGTATVIATGSGFFQAGEDGVLGVDGTTTELTSWLDGTSVSVPVAIPAADAWRVWQRPGALKLANKTAGATNTKEKLTFYSSASAASVTSAEYDVTKATIASVVFSADGNTVASLERYPSELKSRLRVASPTAGAAVTTHELDLFEPRWVQGAQVGDGALLLSGMSGTQRASRLYFVSFATGTVRQLSTTDVIPVKPPKDDDVPAVAVVGSKVFFLTGAVSSLGSSPVGKTVTVNVWDAASPASAPTTLATISDAQIYDLAKYTAQKQSIVVSPDGTHLLLNLVAKSGTIFGNAWAAVPIAGGATKFVAATSDIAVGAPNKVAAADGANTKFVDVASGTSTSMTLGTPLFSPDGATYFTFAAKSAGGSKYSFTASRKAGAAGESKIVSLSSVDEMPDVLAVRSASLLLRLPRTAPTPGTATKYGLYVFP